MGKIKGELVTQRISGKRQCALTVVAYVFGYTTLRVTFITTRAMFVFDSCLVSDGENMKSADRFYDLA